MHPQYWCDKQTNSNWNIKLRNMILSSSFLWYNHIFFKTISHQMVHFNKGTLHYTAAIVLMKKAIISDWLFCAGRKNLKIFRWKLTKFWWKKNDQSAKNHDTGGFTKLFLNSTNFKYMISIWNFFLQNWKLPSIIFTFPSGD